MVTRAFELRAWLDGPILEKATDLGPARSFDDYRNEGWRPL